MKGFLMGNADVVPGVSGGTVALLLGVYEQLIISIQHVDLKLWRHLYRGQWRLAAQHIHLPFLVSLLVGIVSGVICMSMLADLLLKQQTSRQFTVAVFCGMVLASCWVIVRMLHLKTVTSRIQSVLGCCVGMAITLYAKHLLNVESAGWVPNYLQLFICAAIAICAMILPGISGAMILLILGVYDHIIALPGKLLYGIETGNTLIQLVIFVGGAGCGLFGFSRVLRWLLTHQRHPTLSILLGIMLGSLAILWPLQDLQGNLLPVTFSLHCLWLLSTIGLSATVMLLLAHCSVGQEKPVRHL